MVCIGKEWAQTPTTTTPDPPVIRYRNFDVFMCVKMGKQKTETKKFPKKNTSIMKKQQLGKEKMHRQHGDGIISGL